ncbi:hypothetical protein [Demequina lignilytica]|uniref:Uncharacterized protein n=1 Tax=Demequina lignilytica TaxID=3051663 RepID=A0AAW7M554_9MICO|nr:MULTISPECIES: hypothetical protein [unclassified Demequina]MDN4478472.1 hypothetical protein [Demequina sp. SYSU T00039-1]MDN4482370.1 hypothetical protein [Demequina sp. SYSU T0a273]MDN4487021.1 hypothetical protein [Demequina sp. SYSU T00039]MDN4489732.1 hypothetical protein [Demequina sp. SYSU T00068]
MTTIETTTQPAAAKKELPFWAVPAVLATLMLSSGGFLLLLAQSLKILSSIG